MNSNRLSSFDEYLEGASIDDSFAEKIVHRSSEVPKTTYLLVSQSVQSEDNFDVVDDSYDQDSVQKQSDASKNSAPGNKQSSSCIIVNESFVVEDSFEKTELSQTNSAENGLNRNDKPDNIPANVTEDSFHKQTSRISLDSVENSLNTNEKRENSSININEDLCNKQASRISSASSSSSPLIRNEARTANTNVLESDESRTQFQSSVKHINSIHNDEESDHEHKKNFINLIESPLIRKKINKIKRISDNSFNEIKTREMSHTSSSSDSSWHSSSEGDSNDSVKDSPESNDVEQTVSSLPQQPDDNEIVDVSSGDEETTNANNAALNKTTNRNVLKQSTLDNIIQKIQGTRTTIPVPKKILPQKDGVMYCTQKEYTDQARKVSSLRADIVRAKTLLSSMKDKLPDNGRFLEERQLQLEKNLGKEDDLLKKMVVETTDSKSNSVVSWETLQENAAAVVPRTFGKTAMATYTQQKSLTMDRLKDLHGSLASCPSQDTLAEDPQYLKVELMKHQKSALAWLMWRENQKPSGGILADDMGLGKTLTMISLVLKAKENSENYSDNSGTENEDSDWKSKGRKDLAKGGTLIICPASLLQQWEGEVKKRCKRGSLTVEVYHGISRESKPHRLGKKDMVITTYNLAMRECEKNGTLYRVKWKRIILDEAHVVRNYKSQTSVAMCSLHAKSRWALTGTPVHNKELDLYALLKFLRCSPFDDIHIWKHWVTNKNAGGQDRLNTVMTSIMLRRTKTQLQADGGLKDLPKKNMEVIELKLDKVELQVYQKLLIFSRTLFAQFLHQRIEKNCELEYDLKSTQPNFLQTNDPNGEYYKMHKKMLRMHGTSEVKSHDILVLLLRLRQLCCHPSLIVGMLDKGNNIEDDIEEDGIAIDILDKLNNLNLEDDEFAPENNAEPKEAFSAAANKLLSSQNPVFEEVRINGKIRKALEIIQTRVLPNGDKAIIVSQWTSMLRIVHLHFQQAHIRCDVLDGSVPVPQRSELVENFNNPSHKTKVLLLSLTAGGVGLNLIGANHLLLLDLHWNPQLESQAQDRIYRVGQKKTVYVYKLVTLDSIEERIKALQDNKLQMASDVLSGTKPGAGSKLSLDDLKMLFSVGN